MLLINIRKRSRTLFVAFLFIHTNNKELQNGWIIIMSEACEREARSLALEKAYVHQVYQQISNASDSLPDKGRAWPRVKQFLSDLEPGSLVCDVGCGNGKYLDVNPSVFEIGADRCKRLTEVAREKEHEVLMCDNLALPFRDESFDAVLSIAVVHHFATTDRRVQALRELARVLRIGGKLIISVWAMEQRHRKFESQDVLVPWHRPQHLSTPSLEFTSTTTTTTTSEEDGPPPYHAYTQTSDSESARSQRTSNCVRKRGRNRHKGRSIDPARPLSSSQSSSSLSSPNETCYSFVRRALQKLAGGKRGGSGRHRPWFLETWSTCTKEPPPRRYDPDGCEDIDVEDIQDLPIELRRLEEETDLPQRRQTFACSERLSSSVEISLGYKSKSLSDILTVNQKCMVRSRSSVSSLGANNSVNVETNNGSSHTTAASGTVITSQPKPKLVKQKQSLCEEEMEEEGGDQPTDMRDLVSRLPEFKVSISGGSRRYGSVFKQSSMNEELMSAERLREKERVRQNIQKQASLNEEFLFRRQRTFDSLRDTFFSTSTARRFQLLKDGLTNKIKNSTTGIEKVTGASFKNGFVRILQGWKSDASAPQPRPTPPTPPPFEIRRTNTFDEKNGNGNGACTVTTGERRHSKEDGSDSSKDSSLQSDTSVDSEDSFASVIFIPKPELNSETSPPTNTSPPTVALSSPTLQSLPQSPQPTSPKLKTSLPTSPKFKYQSPTSPIIKQPSLPCKYQTPTSPNFKTQLPTSPIGLTKQHSLPTSPKFKYQMPPLSPGFARSNETQIGFQQKLNILNFQQKAHSSSFSVTKETSTDVDSSALFEQPRVKTPPALIDVETIQTKGKDQSPKSETAESVKKEVAEEPKIEGQIQLSDNNFKTKTSLPARQSFPLVRRAASSGANGRQENLAKPLPKLLSLELFNPETDDVDSDSSGVSSPDSVSSVISVLTEELSVESHDAQQTKPSPSDGHSNSTSNSINDSDLNLSDQSISSLPNSKSPEFLTSKSPENVSKSPESVSKSSHASSNSSKSSGTRKIEESKSSPKSSKSPENLSSSSESLSKNVDAPKEEDSKTSDVIETKVCSLEVKSEEMQTTKMVEKHSSKSPETSKPKSTVQKSSRETKTAEDSANFQLEKTIRTRDEKFVTAACETVDERSLSPTKKINKSPSPSKSLIEAAADVASSLEGAVDAVIQSSPRARRKQLELMETSDPAWVMEGDYPGTQAKRKASPEKDTDAFSILFKKCEVKSGLNIRHDIGRKRSPEYLSSHDEPYPDFEFCKIKCHEEKGRKFSLEKFRPDHSSSTENVPLLSSFDRGSNQSLGCYDSETEYFYQKSEIDRLKKEKRRRNPEAAETVPRSLMTGSSWSLGRSDRFRACSSDAESERRQRNSSTWSLNRYETIAKIPLGNFYAKTESSVRKVGRLIQESNDHSDLFGDVRQFSEKAEKTPPVPERPIVRIIHEDLSVSTDEDDESNLEIRHRRNYRSHSLSLNNADRLRNIEDRMQSESWDEECRQHLAEFADRLSEKLLAEIDQYRERTVQMKTDSRPIFSSLPAGLENMHDPYLTRLSEELLDLTRLSAELKERNSYLASLSDEDINKELKISSRKTETEPTKKTNPFLTSCLNNDTMSSSNPFSSRLVSNPFLTDPNESEFHPFGINSADDASDLNGQSNFDDSFVPFEMDSPPKNRKASITAIQASETVPLAAEKVEPDKPVCNPETSAQPSSPKLETRTIEGREEIVDIEKIDSSKNENEKSVDRFEFDPLTRPVKGKRQNLLFVKSASLDDSHRIIPRTNDRKDLGELTRSKLSEKNQKIKSDLEILSQKVKAMNSKEQKSEKSLGDKEAKAGNPTDSVSEDQNNGKKSDTRIPSSESLTETENSSKIVSNPFRSSVESSDQDTSISSRKDVRVSSFENSVDAEAAGTGIQRDTSRVTIASSLGHSMESSDPEASGGTCSGSECSRRDISRVTASTASLGHSMESSDPGDVSERTGSGSDFSRKETSSGGTGRTAGSTASLDPESCSEYSKDARHADRRTARCDGRSSSEEIPRKIQLVRQKTAVQETLDTLTKAESFETSLNGSTSQESLPSDNGGGAITFHRYYHVFREGELDQLIEKYVDNLHIISSYYDHANWCVIAEKVQVWTI